MAGIFLSRLKIDFGFTHKDFARFSTAPPVQVIVLRLCVVQSYCSAGAAYHGVNTFC